MSYCININHPEYLNLLQQSDLKPAILKAKMSVWMEENNTTDFPTLEQLNIAPGTVNATLKIIDALEKIQRNVFTQDKLQGWINDLQKQGVSNQQIEFFKEVAKPGMTKDEIATAIAANYSYTVEINTAKEKEGLIKDGSEFKVGKDYYYSDPNRDVYKILYSKENGGGSKDISKQEFENARQSSKPTTYYSNLTVPGGTNYTENEIATPAITPSIKGHAQFATDKGIGWFRSDDAKQNTSDASWRGSSIQPELDEYGNLIGIPPINLYDENEVSSKTRRILEVQSDLFQKGRDKTNLINYEKEDYKSYTKDGYNYFTINGEFFKQKEVSDSNKFLPGKEEKITKQEFEENITKEKTQNQFLQLLNKDNNWVTFFVKSIIQDSAKKGYEKVLFPSGNTAGQIENFIQKTPKYDYQKITSLEKSIENAKKEPFRQSVQTRNFPEGNKKVIVLDFKDGSEIIVRGTSKEDAEQNLQNNINNYLEKNNKIIERFEKELQELKTIVENPNYTPFDFSVIEGIEQSKALNVVGFYENTVANILKKQGYSPKQVTDEYGNTWNEVEIKKEQATSTIFYQREQAKLYQQKARDIFFKKVAGKNLSAEDISNINKELRKLSDEIGDATWELRKSNNTGNYYVAGYKNAPVTLDNYYSPYAGGMFRQKNPQTLESRVEELDKKLMSWARKHGISVQALKTVMEKFPDRYDESALGIADFAKNLIAIADGARIDTLAEEVSHFAIEMLESDPSVARALQNIATTDIYAKVKQEYKDIYDEEIDFRKEALAKMLAMEIVTQFKNSQKNKDGKNIWTQLYDLGAKFFNWVASNFRKNSAARIDLEKTIIPLANSILNEETLGVMNTTPYEALDKNAIMMQIDEHDEETRAVPESEKQKAKFLENAIKTLEDRIEIFKRSAKSQSDITRLRTDLNKIRNTVKNGQFDLGIASFTNLANGEIESIIKYLNKVQKDKNYDAHNANMINDFVKMYEDLFAKFKEDILISGLETENKKEYYEIINSSLSLLSEARAINNAISKVIGIKFLEDTNRNEYGEVIDPDFNAEKEFESIQEDVTSGWRLWVGNYKNASSKLLKAAHKIIVDAKDKVLKFSVQTANNILTSQEIFLKSNHKIDDLFEKDDKNNNTGFLIRKHNYYKYYQAMEAAKAQMAKDLGYESYALISVELLNEEDRKVYYNAWKKFRAENTKQTTDEDGNTISIPADKYINPQFEKLMSNPTFAQYYNKLVETKKEAVNKLPVQYRTERLIYSLPNIRKNNIEKLVNRDKSFFGRVSDVGHDMLFLDPDDTEYGEVSSLNNKMVPIYFTKTATDMSQISLDVAKTFTIFAEMADNFKEMNKIAGPLGNIQRTLAAGEYLDSKKRKSRLESNEYQALETLVDSYVYNIERKSSLGVTIGNKDSLMGQFLGAILPEKMQGKELSFDKISRNLAGAVRKLNLAGNYATIVSGYLKGSGDSIIEDTLGQYTTTESKNWSRIEFMKNMGEILGQAGKAKKTNKMHLIMQENGIIDLQKILFQTTGDRATRSLTSSDIWYAGYTQADFALKGRITLAVLDNIRFYNGQFLTKSKFLEKTAKENNTQNNKAHKKAMQEKWESLREKSLYNAHEVVDGNLKIKPEFSKDVTPGVLAAAKHKIDYVTHYVDGTMAPTDKGKLSRIWMGDFLLIHRGWFLNLVDTRLKKRGVNYVTEEEEWGNFNATADYLSKVFLQLRGKEYTRSALAVYNSLDPVQQKGVLRTALDLVYLNIIAILAALANIRADDDDDDDFTTQYTAYQLNRLLLEQGAGFSPAELIQMIKEPVVGARFLQELTDIKEIFNGDVYESGMYEGYTHAQRWRMRKIPGFKNIYELRYPELKNQYVKTTVNSTYYETMKPEDPEKESLTATRWIFDWLLPSNILGGYGSESEKKTASEINYDFSENYNE